MASASNLPIIGPEDSPASAILQLESAAAEENKMLRLRIWKMWDAWSNGRESPSAIPGFPELIPRSGEVTNSIVPNPLIPCGHPPMPFNDPGMSSMVRPQAPASKAPPPMFIFQGPQLQLEMTYVTPDSFTQPSQNDLSAEQEKVVENPEQEEMARKKKRLEQSLKNMQGLSGQKSMSYSDLCMFLYVHVPVGFKMPKFEKYDRHGNPVAHLKRYCNQLRGSGGKEELLMAYFGESLTGIASEWYTDQETTHWHVWDDMARDFVHQFQYNVDIAPNRNTLSKLKSNITESFREYAVKWREQAARVKASMDEVEMVTIFLQAQEADYFQNMMTAMGRPFAEAIKIGEMVENGLKRGRILSHATFKATSQAAQNGLLEGLMNRNGFEEGAMMVSSSRGAHRSFSQSYVSPIVPPHYYPLQDDAYVVAPPPYEVMSAQSYMQPQHYTQNRAPTPINVHPYQAPYIPQPDLPQYNPRPREPFRKN
ncbi:uncharacterized protein [Nicotiana sylvestris]|uniref:uncharacterized protein n=1 Tax=Nicotiana sylvestris TaxID=4096 RepID=UPI00388CB8EE